MTRIGKVYGEALYALARDEGRSRVIFQQMMLLEGCFTQEPDFLQLLTAPHLSKAERCGILDHCFWGRIEPFLLNFLKLLTEKGDTRHYSACLEAYQAQYNRDNNILSVTAVTAVPMRGSQISRLGDKLQTITGQKIRLTNRVDPEILGGVRLDYDGKSLDSTLSHRLDGIRRALANTPL